MAIKNERNIIISIGGSEWNEAYISCLGNNKYHHHFASTMAVDSNADYHCNMN